MNHYASRRSFLKRVGLGSLATAAAGGILHAEEDKQPGEEILGKSGVATSERPKGKWEPVSDRKIRVGIVGYGECKFGALFYFQTHPNVTVAAVSDLMPDRCAELAKACRCEKTYPSLEALIEDDEVEAVFVATDPPSHARHCIEALRRGKHVASAVPAVFGSLDDAEKLLEAVKSSGLKYMMFETSAYHEDCHAMRQIHRAGGFGELVYSEGEYFHHRPKPIPSFGGWRIGLPPLWYPTHSTAYHCCVGGGSFTEVSCLGATSLREDMHPANNRYKNPFGTEIALLRTGEGGMARMGVSWDTPGYSGERGRVRGRRGSMTGMEYEGEMKEFPNLERPPLPPRVNPGGHRGSHGPLCNEFITAILEDRKPLVDIVAALNLTVPGIVAHQSALKDGELLKIPQYG
ncbi:MAG: Gfo/Idh/MocA family oxidoreductase [Pirellulales bacterium]|nr:Gfo/Idh/MocA family oxidoreductase [Pirellulales bacterium]